MLAHLQSSHSTKHSTHSVRPRALHSTRSHPVQRSLLPVRLTSTDFLLPDCRLCICELLRPARGMATAGRGRKRKPTTRGAEGSRRCRGVGVASVRSERENASAESTDKQLNDDAVATAGTQQRGEQWANLASVSLFSRFRRSNAHRDDPCRWESRVRVSEEGGVTCCREVPAARLLASRRAEPPASPWREATATSAELRATRHSRQNEKRREVRLPYRQAHSLTSRLRAVWAIQQRPE